MSRTLRRPVGMRLAWLLCVAMTGGFVTALIAITGDLGSLWPLYFVPLMIASVVFHVPGAAIVTAATASTLLVLAYATRGAFAIPRDMVVGAVVFAGTGLITGLQSSRAARRQTELLDEEGSDPRTAVYCLDHFLPLFATEIRRSQRYGQTCSVLVLSIDEFAQVVRMYGRPKTDLMLDRLSRIIRLSTRDGDIVGRIGEARFAVVAVGADVAEARMLGGRLHAEVAGIAFEGDALDPVVHLSVTVSSVTCPTEASDAEQALALATRATEQPRPRALEVAS